MIASFQHGFVFIKTRKTGGTSVEIVLSSWCGAHDICTPLIPEDELIRARYGGSPLNFTGDRALEESYLDAIRAADERAMRRVHRQIRRRHSLRLALRHADLGAVIARLSAKVTGRPLLRNHMKAAAARWALPRDFWDRAFKFSVDRHPYEKAVSMTYWRRDRDRHLAAEPFATTLERIVASGRYANHRLYMKDGRLLVDAVYRTEEMWIHIAELGRRIGRELPDPLPRAKGTQRADRRPAREILTAGQRARIQDVCAAEFELLGYER